MAKFIRETRDAATADEVRELIKLTEEQIAAAKLTSRSPDELEYRLAALAKDLDYLRDRLALFGDSHE